MSERGAGRAGGDGGRAYLESCMEENMEGESRSENRAVRPPVSARPAQGREPEMGKGRE